MDHELRVTASRICQNDELNMEKKTLGLIINPVAGLGGRVGLKGSDGTEIQEKALALGAVPQSLDRAIQALERIKNLESLEIITYPDEMGEDAARACAFAPTVVGSITSGETGAEDPADRLASHGEGFRCARVRDRSLPDHGSMASSAPAFAWLHDLFSRYPLAAALYSPPKHLFQ